jgi:quercetin dioxygenase-like cupin family protein
MQDASGAGVGLQPKAAMLPAMEHPTAIRPEEHAVFDHEKMGKASLFHSSRMMAGLNAFEPGQEHALHAHEGMDKLYYVLDGEGLFLLEGSEIPMQRGLMLVAPEGVPHGIRNTGSARLVVLAVLAPGP